MADYRFNLIWYNANLENKGWNSTDITKWALTTGNAIPIANAGTGQIGIVAGAAVQLDASSSTDVDGTIVSYAWVQTAGDTVTLSDTNIVNPTFTAPSTDPDQTLTFQVTVTDDAGDSSTDTVDSSRLVGWLGLTSTPQIGGRSHGAGT